MAVYAFFKHPSRAEIVPLIVFGNGYFIAILVYLVIIWKREKLKYILEIIPAVIEQRCQFTYSPAVENQYRKTSDFIERWAARSVDFMLKIFIPLCTIPYLCSGNCNYYTYHSPSESFHLMYPSAFPYDWKKPVAHFITICIQALQFGSACLFSSMVVWFFASLCLFGVAFIRDLEACLKDLDKDLNSDPDRLNQLIVKEKLSGIIQFYIDAKQLVNEFSDFFKPIIGMIFYFARIFIAALILICQQSFMSGNLVEFWRTVLLLSAYYAWIYIACFYGDKLTSAFEDFHESVYMMDWYLLPLKMQKMMPTFLLMAHQNVYMQGYPNFECTLQTFEQLVKMSYEFVAVMQQLLQTDLFS